MIPILISPHISQGRQIQRIDCNTQLTNFLIQKGFLPIIACFDTDFSDPDHISSWIEKYLNLGIAGIILTGGTGVDTALYQPKAKWGQMVEKNQTFRDIFEIKLFQTALKRKIPIFGICRGMQLINICRGGSLQLLDLQPHKWHKHRFPLQPNSRFVLDEMDLEKTHPITLTTEGLLSKHLGTDNLKVNSIHSQGIAKLGHGLTIEAQSKDGLIEAISFKKNRVLATQWHPELSLDKPESQEIFNLWFEWVTGRK